MIDFDYRAPTSLDEALALLQQYGDDARVIAGGTALIIMMKQRLVQPGLLVSLRRVGGLEGVRADNGNLHLGAMTTHRAVETDPIVRQRWPLLAETYRHVATVRIRNMATVGGGIVHGDPNQDPPPALIALDARARLRSATGEREVPLQQFFRDYYETDVQPGEVLTEIVVPAPPAGAGWSWKKFLPRTADDYATVSVACWLTLEPGTNRCRDLRVALGSVGTTPVRAEPVEAALRGQELTPERLREASHLVEGQVDPISDFRGSADYKRDMAVVWTRRALEEALQRARGA
ncbi:MAG TPA: xanthine dehydrogenase family protein subunit M [Chloroflexota bacterium]|nr:xanthine dehydrogenase family protein subunit M [Chloroflexota bacterium]